jgi:hypothetical protein
MNEMQQRVHEFLLKHLGATPSGWANKTGTLNKWLLIREEFEELTAALDIDPNGIEPEQGLSIDEPMAVDAICDLLYVIFNLCEELELDIESFFNEVHRSNMTKVPAALSPNKKVQKGPSWEAPRIVEMLEATRKAQRFFAESGYKDPYLKDRESSPLVPR